LLTSNIITAIKITKKGVEDHVACMGETNISENVFGNPAGEGHIGKPRRRWMALMWILWKYGVDWTHEDQHRDKEWAVLKGIRNLRLPQGEGYFFEDQGECCVVQKQSAWNCNRKQTNFCGPMEVCTKLGDRGKKFPKASPNICGY